ncbi:hypothetical protein [Vibrio sp. WXL103]|uniref:hypothetical protein n=1 Tax=Vibrio sp. WXL103 TaxID=3450710 RepID=UPI003EC90966
MEYFIRPTTLNSGEIILMRRKDPLFPLPRSRHFPWKRDDIEKIIEFEEYDGKIKNRYVYITISEKCLLEIQPLLTEHITSSEGEVKYGHDMSLLKKTRKKGFVEHGLNKSKYFILSEFAYRRLTRDWIHTLLNKILFRLSLGLIVAVFGVSIAIKQLVDNLPNRLNDAYDILTDPYASTERKHAAFDLIEKGKLCVFSTWKYQPHESLCIKFPFKNFDIIGNPEFKTRFDRTIMGKENIGLIRLIDLSLEQKDWSYSGGTLMVIRSNSNMFFSTLISNSKKISELKFVDSDIWHLNHIFYRHNNNKYGNSVEFIRTKLNGAIRLTNGGKVIFQDCNDLRGLHISIIGSWSAKINGCDEFVLSSGRLSSLSLENSKVKYFGNIKVNNLSLDNSELLPYIQKKPSPIKVENLTAKNKSLIHGITVTKLKDVGKVKVWLEDSKLTSFSIEEALPAFANGSYRSSIKNTMIEFKGDIVENVRLLTTIQNIINILNGANYLDREGESVDATVACKFIKTQPNWAAISRKPEHVCGASLPKNSISLNNSFVLNTETSM